MSPFALFLDLLDNKAGAQFYDTRIYNYSQFLLLPKQSAIYVVENKVTLLKLDMNSFFLLDSYTLPTPQKLIPTCQDSSTCHQAKEISLLAVMPNEQMVWFCYLHYYEHINRPPQCADSACMVPQPGNLAEPVVQWDNPHFNSLDPTQLANVLNADDGFTYISAFAPDYLRIFRAHMPDWNGRVNWTGALVTDKSRIYIAEPARIMLTFETENEVYFVLREQQTNPTRFTRHSGAHKGWKAAESEGTVSDVARLVRICKGDRGGLPQRSAETFGTFAKADLHCTAADESGGSFAYTHLQAVYWENTTKRLFASFGTEKWAPVGSALCMYSKRNIEDAFNGPLLQPVNPGISQPATTFPNSFPDICQRFNSNNLTSEELAKGRRISLTFPSRNNPIEPMYHKALIVQTGVSWTHLQAYSLAPLPTHYHFGNPAHTTVVWLGTKSTLTKLAIYEDAEAIRSGSDPVPVVCKLNELGVGRKLDLLSRSFVDTEPSRGRAVPSEKKTPKDPMLSEERLVLQYMPRPARRTRHSVDRGNQPEEIRQIEIYVSQPQMRDLLTERMSRHERNWLPWSPWSPCEMSTNTQFRQRTCHSGTVCVGSSREQRLCTAKSIWSGQFSALTATAPFYEQSDLSQIRGAGRNPTTNPKRGFTMTHLVLVAVCSVLIGGLITSIIFYALWQPCCIFPSVGNCNGCSPKKRSSRGCSNVYNNKYGNSQRTSLHGNEQWSIPDSGQDTWSGSKSVRTDTWSKGPNSSTVYDTLIDHSKDTRKPQRREHRTRRPPTRFGSSLIQLLSSGTPLPSPTSAISGPSTASTVMKDKFTFDNVDVNEDLNAANSSRAPSTTPSFGVHHPRLAVHTLVRSDRSNGPSVEIIKPQVKPPICTTKSDLRESLTPRLHHNPLHQRVQSPWEECTESESLKATHFKPNLNSRKDCFNPVDTQVPPG
ncbi:putative plexin [Fasciola gigantica]|uniref:Putative plexin n=1 Tax=Fasciola gigantica TaxID=46835 RepID=A0A504YVP0_FASGI|nr:putative plexin [Fasciola gigantica]